MTDNERKELLMKAKPILFNTEMVKAILDGRKTVTRRVALPNEDLREFKSDKYPGWWLKGRVYKNWDYLIYDLQRDKSCKCEIGDILYVRETWGTYSVCEGIMPKIYYKADENTPDKIKWIPSIHMPKEAARIFLRVTNVRVERLQDCGNMQAKYEGCSCCSQFSRIWDSTIKKSDLDKYGWAANPWVWVIEFERID